jgi:hypothetical protein
MNPTQGVIHELEVRPLRIPDRSLRRLHRLVDPHPRGGRQPVRAVPQERQEGLDPFRLPAPRLVSWKIVPVNEDMYFLLAFIFARKT